MDPSQVEPRRETIFKDAVLSAAEAKSVEIISSAQQAANKEIARVQAACGQADHQAIAAKLSMETGREHSVMIQEARQNLLRHRGEMVDGLFGEVEERLRAFTQSDAYPQWLAARLKRCAQQMAGKAPTVWLRRADWEHRALVEENLPGAAIKEDAGIRLGGLKADDGHRLFDFTLDAALADEKENFAQNSGLTL